MNWFRERFLSPKASNLPVADPETDAEVQFHLGLVLSNTEGQARNDVRAAQCYLTAAKLNHPLAQFNLGLMYALGQGVPRNEGEALLWIRCAAEQGDAGAQFNLGTRCHRSSLNDLGTDQTESRVESFKWLQLAATQGYKQASAVCERVTIGMSLEEVTEGGRRVAAFLSAKKAG